MPITSDLKSEYLSVNPAEGMGEAFVMKCVWVGVAQCYVGQPCGDVDISF